MTTLKTACYIIQDDCEYTDFAIYIDNYQSRDYIAEFALHKTARLYTALQYRSASLGEAYEADHEPNQVPPHIASVANALRNALIACHGVVAIANKEMDETKANASLIEAAPELLAAAELADQLCELITQWAYADLKDAFGIMDQIVSLAQDESQPKEAVLKARGAVTPSLAQGA